MIFDSDKFPVIFFPTVIAVILLVALRFNPVAKHYEDIEEMKNLMKSKAQED